MTDPFEGVVGLLDQEIELHRQLLTLVRAEQRALVQGNADEVSSLIGRQQTLVGEIRALERARMGLVQLIAEREGRESSDLSLAALAGLSVPETGARFSQQREILADLLRELGEANRVNAFLVRDHLAHLRTIIELITRSATVPGYGSDDHEVPAPSLVIDRIT